MLMMNEKLKIMQERLLKVATVDRSFHLSNYIKNIKLMDAKAFDNLIGIINGASKYNHTLEDELLYLKKIKNAYDQLFKQQKEYRTVCQECGENNLELSDISLLNIEYIDNRISAIEGYLTNIKTIEQNKNELEVLNDELVNEEKKREFLNKKIKLYEKKIRDDFLHASLKQVAFGKVESFSVVSEYSKLGYDVINLIDKTQELEVICKNLKNKVSDVEDSYNAAVFCYNKRFDAASREVLKDAENELCLIKYKYIMLEILKLLSYDVDNCEAAKVKRERFVELVNNRNIYLKKLGIKNPMDIISIVDVDSQMKDISSLLECIDNIHNIRKKVGNLSNNTEKMINENNNYLISLNDTQELIKSNVGFNDVDITAFDDILKDDAKVKKIVLDNQVVGVKSISSSFRLILSKQKANGVIERINKMYLQQDNLKVNKKEIQEEFIPELIIEKPVSIKTDNIVLESDILEKKPHDELKKNEENSEMFIESNNVFDSNKEIQKSEEIRTDIFETTTPFSEPVMFSDRLDNVIEEVNEVKVETSEVNLPILDVKESELMPDAFWVVDNNSKNNNNEEVNGPSFDEQISALLAETQEDVNVRKRAA